MGTFVIVMVLMFIFFIGIILNNFMGGPLND